jgi:hypothetical protein
MRDLWKRLERLEATAVPPERMRIVRTITGTCDGQSTPWNPGRASNRRRRAQDVEEDLVRNPGEPIEAFEARAAAHFPGDYIIG